MFEWIDSVQNYFLALAEDIDDVLNTLNQFLQMGMIYIILSGVMLIVIIIITVGNQAKIDRLLKMVEHLEACSLEGFSIVEGEERDI